MRIAYADPPYIGCAYLYRDHPDYGGEVDHADLLDRLEADFDGWVLHAAATPRSMAVLAPLVEKIPDARWMSWVKGFAAFKKNVSVAYAWEPVIIKPARKPVVSKRLVNRDWIDCPITLKRGLTGAKPEKVCHWAFEMVGAHPDDTLVDMFPGSGAVARAWKTWQGKFALPPFELVSPGRPTGATRRQQSARPENVYDERICARGVGSGIIAPASTSDAMERSGDNDSGP